MSGVFGVGEDTKRTVMSLKMSKQEFPYEPYRAKVHFVGKRDALRELVAKLLEHLSECRSDRFQLEWSLKELPPLKPKQETLDSAEVV